MGIQQEIVQGPSADDLMRFDQFFPRTGNPLAQHVLVHSSVRGGMSVGVFTNRVGALTEAVIKAGREASPYAHDKGMFFETTIRSTYYVLETPVGDPDLVRIW